MRRYFSRKQRRYLAILSGWRCAECGTPLSKDLHGDHTIPFSKGGVTALRNGRATCPKCNLSKGAFHEYQNLPGMAERGDGSRR